MNMTNALKILDYEENNLLRELAEIIESSQRQVAIHVNSGVVLMFWNIGNRVNEFVLNNQRAEYGKQIVVTLSRQLKTKYGNNFEEKNFRRMLQFADKFQDYENVVTLSRFLSWSHFLVLIPLETYEKQQFYALQTAKQSWGVRELRKQIKNKAFERTEIANSQLLPDKSDIRNIFKDPYFLNSLGLKDSYVEKDLENAIIKDIEEFILEIGKGFAFIERQKRMIIDGDDFYLDLLFFHRTLNRLVAIDLKIDKFHAKYKGQMELYLKWLNRYERQDGENEPIGLILCAETSREQVELLEMHKDGIIVAEYWTELPPRNKLEEKLHLALQEARERLERRKLM
jgi:predicted nuclease of restriction endonuclease-like (RecB) superfamily